MIKGPSQFTLHRFKPHIIKYFMIALGLVLGVTSEAVMTTSTASIKACYVVLTARSQSLLKKNPIKKIYFDMDGVLVDFATGLAEQHGISLEEFHKRRIEMREIDPTFEYGIWLFYRYINEAPLFQNYPPMPYLNVFVRLMNYWRENGIQVEILSSVSSFPGLAKPISKQKNTWLAEYDLSSMKRTYTQGSIEKLKYAKPGVLLIDDLPGTIEGFKKSGGDGIVHETIEQTIEELRSRGLVPDDFKI